MRSIAIMAGILVLAGCTQEPGVTQIDGSDQGRYQETVAQVRDTLSGPDQLRFEAALKLIQADVFTKAKDRESYNRMIRQRLNGKSAAEVIAEAEGMTKGLTDKAVDAVFDAKRVATEEAKKLGAAVTNPAKEGP